MITYIKNGVRITMTPAEEAAWNARVAARPAPPLPPLTFAKKLAALLVAHSVLSQSDVDAL